MSVSFIVGEKFPYCRCRACDHRMLWFAVWLRGEEDYYEVGEPFVSMVQTGSEDYKSYCPYCGKKEMWAEDS